MSTVIESSSEIEPPAEFYLLEEPSGPPEKHVKILGVDRETAYGVEFDRGERVRIDAIGHLIERDRLVPADAVED